MGVACAVKTTARKFGHRTTFHTAGTASASSRVADGLQRPQRTPAHGADRLQSPVPVVRRVADGRSRLERDHIQQEPRSSSGRNVKWMEPRRWLRLCGSSGSSRTSPRTRLWEALWTGRLCATKAMRSVSAHARRPGDLWVAEDGRSHEKDAVRRPGACWLDVHLVCRYLQSRPDTQPMLHMIHSRSPPGLCHTGIIHSSLLASQTSRPHPPGISTSQLRGWSQFKPGCWLESANTL